MQESSTMYSNQLSASFPTSCQHKTGWPWITEDQHISHIRLNNQQWPRISLITPSFNQEQYLEEAIRSILLQGYPNLEYFVIDGGSTDNSVAIIRKYAPWLTYWISEPDRGQTHALNKGFSQATGDIVGFLNSDDLLLPDALFRVATYMNQLRAQWLVGSCQYLRETTQDTWIPKEIYSLPHWLAGEAGLPQRSTFWTRQMWKAIGPFREDMHYAFDDEYWIRALAHGFQYRVIAENLAIARVHSETKTMQSPKSFIEEKEKIQNLYLSTLDKRERTKFNILMRQRLVQEGSLYCLDVLAESGRKAALMAAMKELRKHHIYSFRRCYFGMLRRVIIGVNEGVQKRKTQS